MGLFKSADERVIKKLYKLVDQINEIEKKYKEYSGDELRELTEQFKKRLEEGETLDDILCEAYAAVKVAATRTIGQTPYDVQILGAIVLHQGRIAELKTGEGKTLMSTMAGYLNALTGEGVHLVTVNEYLAKHQSEWMGKVYTYLGLTVGLLERGQSTKEKQDAYKADITYGISSEYGFDYLRDSMQKIREGIVQRSLAYVMIDEIDSILIDEARSPLIISGSASKRIHLYERANRFVQTLTERPETPPTDKFTEYDENDPKYKGDYDIDEKASTIALTEEGIVKAESAFNVDNLSDPDNMEISHHINQALRANYVMKKDKDYIIKDRMVVIVDQNTGRARPGRRFSDGLHQAIEAKEKTKEKVEIQSESETIASITLQNYFRMYKKMSGMTATAKSEEEEFRTIYGMDVIVVPTNKPMVRVDENDVILMDEKCKFDAIVADVKNCYEKKQPVLVGTASVEISEKIAKKLKQNGIKHSVLNAKKHREEANIVAQAGRIGKVTIATNMAGRGTDIKLGGDPDVLAKNDLLKEKYTMDEILTAAGFTELSRKKLIELREKYRALYEKHKEVTDKEHDEVVKVGGLRVIGTERHEARRIDDQLRGRSGRQGDTGSSKFYISLQDDMVRIYTQGREGMLAMTQNISDENGYLGESKFITRLIERAQKMAESRSFASRKRVLQYDNVINEQRKIIYAQMREVLEKDDIKESVVSMIEDFVNSKVDVFTAESEYPEDWNINGILIYFNRIFAGASKYTYLEGNLKGSKDKEKIKVANKMLAKAHRKENFFDIPKEEREKLNRDKLKEIINEQAMKSYDYIESQLESLGCDMRQGERHIVLSIVNQNWRRYNEEVGQLRQGINLRGYGQRDPLIEFKLETNEMFDIMIQNIRMNVANAIYKSDLYNRIKGYDVLKKKILESYETKETTFKSSDKKVGRNDLCPCGSGKKYKKCCGKND